MVTKPNILTWSGASVDESDFEEIYRAELPRIYNFFRYRIGDGQLAEDLTSETFEKAWRNRARYDLIGFFNLNVVNVRKQLNGFDHVTAF